ncbi:hypothetical protein LX90_004100 [Lentzea flava]|nr:hypothetical protein [Lentzea flava]
MKLNTIARTIAAVILSLGAVVIASGTAAASGPQMSPPPFTPPYVAPCGR